jgi:hypothetical protein
VTGYVASTASGIRTRCIVLAGDGKG